MVLSTGYIFISVLLATLSIIVSLFIILFTVRLNKIIRRTRQSADLERIRKYLARARVAIRNGKLTPVEICVLAAEAGASIEQVRQEYVKEQGSREDVLESVFGNVSYPLLKQIITTGAFMETGYANEKFFLDMTPIVDDILPLEAYNNGIEYTAQEPSNELQKLVGIPQRQPGNSQKSAEKQSLMKRFKQRVIRSTSIQPTQEGD